MRALPFIAQACVFVLFIRQPSVLLSNKSNVLHVCHTHRCQADVFYLEYSSKKKIATLTIKTPDLRNPCEPSDNLIQLFKWLPSDDSAKKEETKLPPLLGQLCFYEEVKKIANSDPSEIERKFFEMLGGGTATPYKAHVRRRGAEKERDFFEILGRGTATPCMRLHTQYWVL